MFATLRAPSCPAAALTAVAQDFTPRFEVIGDCVVLDVSGLSRLFGSPEEIGGYLLRALAERTTGARVAIAPSAVAAMLLVLGRPGLTVVSSHEMAGALAELPLSILGAYERLRREQAEPELMRHAGVDADAGGAVTVRAGETTARVSDVHDPMSASLTVQGRGGWQHPRQTHQAGHMRRAGRAVASSAARRAKTEALDVQATLELLRRWGLATIGELRRLPTADVAERLGERGTRWQRLARGEDPLPLVPWVPEEPFDASLELEWPIEGLEPLSFVLTRLLEPLSERLARADRGAAIIHTRLRLVDKTIYGRQIQLPAPMRDPKTLRTLMLLDLESHPPAAAVDRVGVLIEPTPGRVLQWTLFERAQPSPEQVSTLLARLTALMGDGHVGSPALVDSWKPGVFEVKPFQVPHTAPLHSAPLHSAPLHTAPLHTAPLHTARHPALYPAPSTQHRTQHPAPSTQHVQVSASLRRFRLPVPARVRVHEGRPVRVQVDRRGLSSGPVVQAAGPWRTSGAWWQIRAIGQTDPPERAHHADQPWDRDEWDVSLGDGTVYRLFVEREIGQWFIEGVVD